MCFLLKVYNTWKYYMWAQHVHPWQIITESLLFFVILNKNQCFIIFLCQYLHETFAVVYYKECNFLEYKRTRRQNEDLKGMLSGKNHE